MFIEVIIDKKKHLIISKEFTNEIKKKCSLSVNLPNYTQNNNLNVKRYLNIQQFCDLQTDAH